MAEQTAWLQDRQGHCQTLGCNSRKVTVILILFLPPTKPLTASTVTGQVYDVATSVRHPGIERVGVVQGGRAYSLSNA